MRLIELLTEAPIVDFQVEPNLEINKPIDNYLEKGFSKTDIRLLSNPEKFFRAFNNVPYKFRLFFVNKKSTKFGQIIQKIKTRPSKETITVVLVGNRAGPWSPLTPWILAHRIFHSIIEFKKGSTVPYLAPLSKHVTDLYSIHDTKEFVDDQFYHLVKAIGKPKSFRDGTLARYSESIPEWFAQYMITGDIIFNSLPQTLEVSYQHKLEGMPDQVKYYADESKLAKTNKWLSIEYSSYLKAMFEQDLESCIGKTLVLE